jgi:PleD family two-component response regulator
MVKMVRLCLLTTWHTGTLFISRWELSSMPSTVNTRLLLVDDDEAIRDTLTLILQHGRFEVQAASNVNDALRLITTQASMFS